LKTTKLTKFSAYGGKNYQIRKNEKNNSFRSEYKKLKTVTIFVPGKEINQLENPDFFQHLDKIDYKKLQNELKVIISFFRQKKITVIEIERSKNPPLNLCFTRDLFWMGPRGIIQARMGSEIRKEEETLFLKTIVSHALNFHLSVKSPCLFEGADALWFDSNTVLLGTKNRTNNYTVKEFRKLFPELKIIEIILPKQVQHLLGMIQFLDKKKVLLRHKIAPVKLKNLLRKNKFQIINIDETFEVTHLQAMNVVTIKPNSIIMPVDCPNIEKIYRENKIRIVAKFKIQELRKAGGGIACAIGILDRGN
jgi:N-dimethylarginine dimethylaminohydrolase